MKAETGLRRTAAYAQLVGIPRVRSVVVLLLWAAVAGQFAGATNGLAWRIGATKVAGFQPQGSTVAEALRSFRASGIDLHPSRDHSLCLLTSTRAGIQLIYGSFPGQPPPSGCAGYEGFMDATVVNRQWQTPSGLRVGDSIRALRRAYPKAHNLGLTKPRFFTIRNWTAWWWLTDLPAGQGSGTILTALTTHGHIVALAVEPVGH